MNERLLIGQMLDLYASGREADQQQRIHCQRGEHDMLATASPGVVVCRLCRTLGVCLWCGMTLPQGACVVVCARHGPLAQRRPMMTYDNRFRADDTGETEMEYDDSWPTRLPSSSRRYAPLTTRQQGNTGLVLHPDQGVQRTPIPARRSAQQRLTEEQPPAPPHKSSRGLFRSHPLLWVGFGMLVMLLLWTALQALGGWWSLHQDDVTYGRPRTAQYDVVVGHHDSPSTPTHMIALNLNATVVIIELPGGDTSKARFYRGPQLFGPSADLYPVTLTFPDPSGNGLPNMDIHVQGQIFVYLNQNGQFVPQPSSH